MALDRITLTLFSDPMMGLAYECEPTLDRLSEHYGDALELRHAMVVLVRDMADFMTAEEKAMPPHEGLLRYNARLAQIYLDEEGIGGLPMNMEGFHLFDETHRTSRPLCLAFEAARLVTPDRAEVFLRAVRRATIVEGRMTTRASVLREIAGAAGIDLTAYDNALASGSADLLLQDDERLAARTGIRGLPALLIQTGRHAVLTSPLLGFDRLRAEIDSRGD